APVADALRRIEEAGQRALASMDRTVEMLNGEPGAAAGRHVPGIEALPQLADGFSPSARVSLTVEPGPDVPRETSATAYRVVTEALTNVRRHATRATRVDITVTREDARVLVRVTDDGGGHSEAPDRGGFGLVGLAEQVEMLGGTLSAGPTPGGWSVRAAIPA
ncbi:ATP-binding protein, partial [Nonomuraea sp. NPDC005983]|uniref:sensor histidine kinase n=1 Tax=Nonomuraea sp. NPDC005983 TaxID=3155595 RepID=UPI0033A3D0F1